VENVWQYLRANWLFRRAFESSTISAKHGRPGRSSSFDL
jgi:hypothetical protein